MTPADDLFTNGENDTENINESVTDEVSAFTLGSDEAGGSDKQPRITTRLPVRTDGSLGSAR